jgi:hypothetical protein
MICSVLRTKKLLVASLLVILIIGSLTLLAYSGERAAMGDAVRMGMESTAGVMATQVSPSDLAGLKAGDENTPKYIAITRKLQNMRSMDQNILNAYILKVNPDKTVTFLVDDLYPSDPQGSAKIGEVSTAPDKMDILAALSGPTSTKVPYTTKYGSFMTAYAPIDDSVSDSGGNTYAILAIDIAAKDYSDYTSRGGIILLTGFVSMIIAVGAIFWFGGSRRDDEKKE